MTYTLY